MATLKRSHTPIPRGARVEMTVWTRSQPGKPRRRRSDRPPLMHDPGWDWDGTRIFFSDTMFAPEVEECGAKAQAWEDAQSPVSGRPEATLSLLDVARYRATKKSGKASAKSSFNNFGVIRVPEVVPVAEEEPDLWDSWGLSEWEKLDVVGLKKTYSEAARGCVGGGNCPDTPGCSHISSGLTEDDSWEYL